MIHDALPDFLADSSVPTARSAAGASAAAEINPKAEARTTKFLALDKCLPGRDFLQMVEIPLPLDDTGDAYLRYDPDWLAVVRATLPHFHVSHQRWRPPPDHEIATALEESKAWVATHFGTRAYISNCGHG